MSLFGRYLQHPAVATTGRTALVDDELPLDAGRMAWLANNAVHLAEQNPLRALRQHPGVNGFYAAALPDPAAPSTPFTGIPDADNIRWDLSQKDGGCAIDLGLHYAWPLPSGNLPRLRVSFTAKVEGGFTLGWVLVVAPGSSGPTRATLQRGDSTTSGSWVTQTTDLELNNASLRLVDYSPTNGIGEADPPESGGLRCFRAFLGAYNSSNTNAPGSLAWIRGVSLRFEGR